ncbi:hypothetical protein [Natronoglycomyces albus]|uniref:Uncharacterized protein n=1 Tax=Natronoglycomyces albus TaxID=2811108 RepID=A0A895XKB8_9ACTN|nr:hypothetical protein [Natronoglycomyces albus]QSB04003.1 hypothetical protein JQS30_09215 [Natronoglycomyces albus]
MAPAKSKHMQRRKERATNARKTAKLAAKFRRSRRVKATVGLAIIMLLLVAYVVWQFVL